MNFVTGNEYSQQYVVSNTEMIHIGVLRFLVFAFWNLSPDLNCRVALTEIFRARSSCISASFIFTEKS